MTAHNSWCRWAKLFGDKTPGGLKLKNVQSKEGMNIKTMETGENQISSHVVPDEFSEILELKQNEKRKLLKMWKARCTMELSIFNVCYF